MRATVDIKWFAMCTSLEQAKVYYRELSRKHHPDMGGDVRIMQEINVEFDEIKRNPWRLNTSTNAHSATGDWWQRTSYEQEESKARTWSDFNTESTPKRGYYTVRITEVIENEQKKYVALVFDICEGEHKNYFKSKPWYKHVIYLSYKTDWQLNNTRRIIEKINRSNPGFDGDYCFCNDQAEEFVGQKIGVYITEEYFNGEGFINERAVYSL